MHQVTTTRLWPQSAESVAAAPGGSAQNGNIMSSALQLGKAVAGSLCCRRRSSNAASHSRPMMMRCIHDVVYEVTRFTTRVRISTYTHHDIAHTPADSLSRSEAESTAKVPTVDRLFSPTIRCCPFLVHATADSLDPLGSVPRNGDETTKARASESGESGESGEPDRGTPSHNNQTNRMVGESMLR